MSGVQSTDFSRVFLARKDPTEVGKLAYFPSFVSFFGNSGAVKSGSGSPQMK
jgi:hypothetical protein